MFVSSVSVSPYEHCLVDSLRPCSPSILSSGSYSPSLSSVFSRPLLGFDSGSLHLLLSVAGWCLSSQFCLAPVYEYSKNIIRNHFIAPCPCPLVLFLSWISGLSCLWRAQEGTHESFWEGEIKSMFLDELGMGGEWRTERVLELEDVET